MSLFPPRPPVPNTIQIAQYIDLAVAVAEEAASAGKHPFGAVLLNERGEVLMRQGNESTVRHAEAELARRAGESPRVGNGKQGKPSEHWSAEQRDKRLTRAAGLQRKLSHHLNCGNARW